MKWILLALLVFTALSLAAFWSWGQFASRALGAPSRALAVSADATALDRLTTPLLDAHPGHSGAALVAANLDAFVLRAFTARLAQRSLDVQYYLWHDDLTGRLLKDELMAAAERGVRVRMLIDDMNGLGMDDTLLAMDAHPNLQVRLFNPSRNRGTAWRRALEMALRFFTFNRRMHNKAWVADGRVALVGGRNIGDEYFDAAESVNFQDADLLLLGPAVTQTEAVFDQFWNSSAVIPIQALHGDSRRQTAPAALQAQRQAWRADAEGSHYAQALARRLGGAEPPWHALRLHWLQELRVVSDPPEKAGPVSLNRTPERWLMFDVLQTLFAARREVRLISPYFVPGGLGTMLFTGQVARGVDVRILTNSLAANDVPAVHAGYQRYRAPLLAGGVHVWELKPQTQGSGPENSANLLGSSGASLHTKAFVVDGERGFVGSFNFDPRSASLNTEMGVLFHHAALGAELAALFEQARRPSNAYALTLQDGQLRWQDAHTGQTWQREPEAGWLKRAMARVLGWLPIESHL
ncbi:MAG: phospholipase D family protein [Comamonadaceae bacterium]|nr:phospholipase D family protein [Comamonadaceae bacterium]